MIFLVIATLFLYRGAQIKSGNFPFQDDGWWPFASKATSYITPNSLTFETIFIVAQIAVVMGFLILVLYSKHMHIFTEPLNVFLKRQPKALGALGTTPDLEKLMEDENAVLGAGQVEHFHQQQLLQTLACTECGRCQDKCPAWNTGKPLNPKLVITAIRDQMFAESDRLIGKQPVGAGSQDTEAEPKMLVPDVIDPDVLWSCTTCGACVEECPVDIEHVDAIVDMRRYQVLMESSFPSEAGVMLRNIENNGNPWGMSANARLEWTEGVDFDIPVVTDHIPDDIDWLYWVGCAGALDDRARRSTQAIVTGGTNHGLEYDPPSTESLPPNHGRVAAYARGPDYHRTIWDKLDALASWLEAERPGCSTRAVADTAPLLERDFARRAGLGWVGKNTMLINPITGSFFFLAEV